MSDPQKNSSQKDKIKIEVYEQKQPTWYKV